MNVAHAINHELSVHRINTIDRTTMIELLNNNFSYDEIAQTLGIAKGTVFNYIRKFNIKKIYE
ncbi:helix-turn-helix domain-containing protein [Clostridium sp. VAP51]|uniref:helix-turn-helix domain-containing protein n=1 Tax=Clostridium sp. VAP51 TaxID=2949978 RepID=UPI00207ABC1B|nr:helix-turn-helix domain-containing protein [Clostridium sp. VAP51]